MRVGPHRVTVAQQSGVLGGRVCRLLLRSVDCDAMRTRHLLMLALLGLAAPLHASDARSAEDEAPPAKHGKTTPGGIAEQDAKFLRKLLESVGAKDAKLRRVERTIKKQTRVIYDLAKEDVQRAKDMYCDAGDAVIDVYDQKASEAQNLERMRAELLTQLPRARELGCLNHIENDEIYAVDVAVELLSEERRAAFVAAAKKAVSEGKAERFLQPPRHPDAFHFEFRRR